MQRSTVSNLLVFALVSLFSIRCPAQSGIIFDKATGTPVAGALITRSSDKMSVSADSLGSFNFQAASINRERSLDYRPLPIPGNGASLFGLAGRRISPHRAADGIYVLRVSAGGADIWSRVLLTTGGIPVTGGMPAAGPDGGRAALARVAAALDTLYAWKGGYYVAQATVEPAKNHEIYLEKSVPTRPVAGSDLIFGGNDTLIVVEAECFFSQTNDNTKAWYITAPFSVPDVKPDIDSPHYNTASGGAYVEVLPDSGHDGQKIIPGVTYSKDGGVMAVISYKVLIRIPGRYYIWARALGTDGDDNTFHMGINNNWPNVKMHVLPADEVWRWTSRHRDTGEKVFFDIKDAGVHTISISMREDGSEVDRFLLVRSENYTPPELELGPPVTISGGYYPDFSLWAD